MPRRKERQLKEEARKKGLGKERTGAYIHRTTKKIAERRAQKRGK